MSFLPSDAFSSVACVSSTSWVLLSTSSLTDEVLPLPQTGCERSHLLPPSICILPSFEGEPFVQSSSRRIPDLLFPPGHPLLQLMAVFLVLGECNVQSAICYRTRFRHKGALFESEDWGFESLCGRQCRI